MKFKFLPNTIVNDKLVSFVDANISIANHGFQYGTAAWGGLRVRVLNDGDKKSFQLFRLDEHVKRIYEASKMLFLNEVDSEKFTEEYFKKKILEFVNVNKEVETDFYIRPIIYSDGIGPMPDLDDEKSFCVYGVELGDYLDSKGISLSVSSFRRQEDVMIPTRGKISGAYYTAVAAKAEAKARGFDDALMLTQNGKVSEGSAMNIFMVRDGKLVTPLGTDGILEGITRKSVLEIAKYLGIEVIERQIDLSELMYKSEEVFLTGTAARLTPCVKIEHINLQSDFKMMNQIKQELEKIYSGENENFKNWITEVGMI